MPCVVHPQRPTSTLPTKEGSPIISVRPFPHCGPPFQHPSHLLSLHPSLPHASDLSTDGRWCFFVFWVIPRPPPRVLSHPSPSSTPLPMPVRSIKWSLLRQRLLTVCPSSDPVFPLPLASSHSSSRLLLPLPSTMTVPAQINGESEHRGLVGENSPAAGSDA